MGGGDDGHFASREDRFVECLLGFAVDDALGAHFEGQMAESVAERYGSVYALLENPPAGVSARR